MTSKEKYLHLEEGDLGNKNHELINFYSFINDLIENFKVST